MINLSCKEENKDVMCFNTKEGYYLEPLFEIACDQLEKGMSAQWTAGHIRDNIPRLQKHWVAYKGILKWIRDFEKQDSQLAKFMIKEIKERCKIGL